MSHIDRDLLVLISTAETEFEERARKKVQIETAKAIIAILDKALEGSDGEKALAFRKIAEARIEQVRRGLDSFLEGEGYYEDEDHLHYLSEEVDKTVFGPDFYNAFNKFGRLFT